MKKRLRQWARDVMASLAPPPDVTAELTALDEYKSAKTVFCYVSVSNEPRTTELISHALECGKVVCVPRCRGGGIMEPTVITSLCDLVPGTMGIPEPTGGRVLTPGEIDFAVIPCLCANEKGYRLGHGGGYYDRFLEKYSGFSLLLCRSQLKLDDVPRESHDLPASRVMFV